APRAGDADRHRQPGGEPVPDPARGGAARRAAAAVRGLAQGAQGGQVSRRPPPRVPARRPGFRPDAPGSEDSTRGFSPTSPAAPGGVFGTRGGGADIRVCDRLAVIPETRLPPAERSEERRV